MSIVALQKLATVQSRSRSAAEPTRTHSDVRFQSGMSKSQSQRITSSMSPLPTNIGAKTKLEMMEV